MTKQPPVVFVVDADVSIRDALRSLTRSVGLSVEFFSSPLEFLQGKRPDSPSCLVLETRLPGKSGLDFQRELAEANIPFPIIFLTGYGDIPMSVRAMKAGAIEFLTKPFREQDLLDAIQQGLERDRARRAQEAEVATLRERYESLTPREREVLPWAVSGLTNKGIADAIGISEATIKVHRSQLMRKMGAPSLADLVRMTGKMSLAVPQISQTVVGPSPMSSFVYQCPIDSSPSNQLETIASAESGREILERGSIRTLRTLSIDFAVV